MELPELPETDDTRHEPTSDHPHWTETSYWGFYVPERRLSATVYNMWRKNLGLVASRVWIWDQTGETPMDARYAYMAEHVVIPDDADPVGAEYSSGTVTGGFALRSDRFASGR
jgi:hypothetical protein